jgi:limonene-1,2-epoxide hydrolase
MFNDRDHEALDQIYAPEFFSHATGRAGVESVKASRRHLVGTCPAAQVQLQEIVVDGEIVATRSLVTGVGALYDGSDLLLMEMFRVRHGRIVELRGNPSPRSRG